jgi:PAS domain S-box-containing protein
VRETTPPQRAEQIEIETLTRHLEQMAADGGDPLGIMQMLASALFPDGVPARDRVTWGERGAPHPARASIDAEEDAAEKLRTAEARYRTLVEQIPAVTFLAALGEGKNEVYVSPHIEQMLGFSQDEWLEAPFLWYWQLHPDDRQILNDEFARGCRTGGPFKAECRFFARDGRIVWVHGEARLVKDGIGRPSLLQGIAFDITDSKRAQKMLVDQATRKARSDEELAIARRVQTSILPQKVSVSGLEISATMIPATEVGGDYYDVLPCEGGGWIAIGDVSGHGLNSGLVMLMVQSAMAALLRVNPNAPPAEVLTQLNAVLYENIRLRLHHDDHVTLSLLRYKATGEVVFAGAHEDILVYRRSGRAVERVATQGVWLGGMREIGSATVDSKLQLQIGDVVLLYTDGITEAMNKKRDQFDIDRLTATFLEVAEQPCERIRDHVLATVRKWMHEQKDDMSLLVMRYVGVNPQVEVSPAPRTAPALGAFFATSIFQDATTTQILELCTRPAGSGQLGSTGLEGRDGLSLRLDGSAELNDQEHLRNLLATLHARATETGVRTVEIDFRSVRFMSSACLKELVGFVGAAKGLPAAKSYRVRFVGDPLSRWQRSSLGALVAFGEGVIAER